MAITSRIFKHWDGSLDDFKQWLGEETGEGSKYRELYDKGCIVFIHENTADLESGYVYAFGQYYTASAVAGLDATTLATVLAGGRGVTAKIYSTADYVKDNRYITAAEYAALSAEEQAGYAHLDKDKVVLESVLESDVTSNYVGSVGYVKNGDVLTKGMTLTEIMEKIFNGETYPDELAKFKSLSSTISFTGSSTININSINIEDADGESVTSGEIREIGETMELIEDIDISATHPTAASVTTKDCTSTNLDWGYKKDNAGTVLTTNLVSTATLAKSTDESLVINTATGAWEGTAVANNVISGKNITIKAGDNTLKVTGNSGTYTATADAAEVYYVSNKGKTDAAHKYNVSGSKTSSKDDSKEWSVTGKYKVFYGYGSDFEISRDSLECEWLEDNMVLLMGGIQIDQDSRLVILVPNTHEVTSIDTSFDGNHVPESAISSIDAGTRMSLDGTNYTRYQVIATAIGKTDYRNVVIAKK